MIRGLLTIVFFLAFVLFSEQLLLFDGRVEDSPKETFFHPLNGTELGSLPSLITRDREQFSVLEVRIEPKDMDQRPLTPQSVTLPTLPRAGWLCGINHFFYYHMVKKAVLFQFVM